MKKVCVVILNYMTYELTVKLIKQLRNIGFEEDIIVIDNNSNNESYTEIKKIENQYKLITIKNDKNSGYASGNNIGIKKANELGYKSVLIANNDIEIENVASIYNMFDLLQSKVSIGCICPRIWDSNEKETPQRVLRPSIYDDSIGIFRFEKRNKEIFFQKIVDFEIYRPHGCCMLLDMKCIIDVDFFDESTFLYFEEDILAEKLMKKGYIRMCCFNAKIIHRHSVTTRKFLKKYSKVKTYIKSANIYYKYYRNWNILKRFPCLVIKGLSMYK